MIKERLHSTLYMKYSLRIRSCMIVSENAELHRSKIYFYLPSNRFFLDIILSAGLRIRIDLMRNWIQHFF
jgi:hypothetical protein